FVKPVQSEILSRVDTRQHLHQLCRDLQVIRAYRLADAGKADRDRSPSPIDCGLGREDRLSVGIRRESIPGIGTLPIFALAENQAYRLARKWFVLHIGQLELDVESNRLSPGETDCEDHEKSGQLTNDLPTNLCVRRGSHGAPAEVYRTD